MLCQSPLESCCEFMYFCGMEISTNTWAKALVDCIHFLHQQGWAPATSSNYSFRPPGTTLLHISSSGIDKGAFRKEDLMKVDLNGQPVEDSRRPSAETLLHTLIYRKREEVACVLHTHSVYNTTLSSIFEAKGRLRLEGFELLKGLSGIRTHDTFVDIPVFSNHQDMAALSKEIDSYWEEHPEIKGFLLAGHGLYTWGQTIAEAKRHVEVFEFLFECFYKIHTFNNL